MSSVELNASSLGPRYAPDDPTLPKPWKGLIDGSTGNLYYWNPETNVTQYERPAPPQPQVPAGPLPATSTPQAASLQAAQQIQSNGLLAQQGQPMTQAPQSLLQQGQQGNQFLQQPAQSTFQQSATFMPQIGQQQMPQTGQSGLQQSSQLGQAPLQPGSYAPSQLAMQMMQHQPQQMMPQALQQMQRQFPQQGQQQFGLQMPQQPGQQMAQQAVQQSQQQPGPNMLQHQGSQMAHPSGNHTLHQQMQPMAYQQSLPEQPDLRKPAPSNSSPAQSFQVQQDYRASIPKREDADFQQANQVGFSPPHFQQRSTSSTQNLPAGSNFGQLQQMGGHMGQGQQFGGFPMNSQQHQYMGQSQQPGPDLAKQHHGPAFQNQMGPMMHAQQSNVPSIGLRMQNEENLHGRPGNEYQYNASKEGPGPSPQRPKLAPIPMVRNMQDISMGPGATQNVLHGQAAGFNAPPGHVMPNMYGHASGGPPFTNTAFTRPPYMGHVEVPNLTPAEAYRQQHEVTATGDNVPAPYMSFEASGFPPEILRELHSAGFTSPTPIQAQTWPIALQSRDVVAIAKTGSGKTLGYLIPAFILLRRRHNNPQNGPTVLVLAPTRELATQIQDEAIKFGRSSRVSCTCLYGGAPKGPQLKELDRGADIVVATPGRLNDILEGRQIDLRQVSLLVLDEADRMLDMGFEPQIRKIVNEIPSQRQTLMYTATWPKEVRKIANDLLINPVQVNIGSVDELAANKAITQYVEVVPQMEKQRRLEQILRSQEHGSKVIVFCSTKRLCDQLARSIGRNFGAVAIHGDKSQGERDWVLNQFRSGKSPILVATDVAARGLDIKDIRVVINYDFPTGIEDYVHRIGRTGRAGATGVSYTFFSEQDWKYAADLIKVLEGANQNVPPEIRDMASRGPGFGKDRGRISRFDSGGGGRWDSGGRGGMRDGNFSGRGGMRDGNFGGRGGMRDGGFGGRGGGRDSFGSRGGRSDFFPGRGSGGRGFGGPGNNIGWGRSGRGPNDRYNMDGRGGFGRGRGRGRFSNRRDFPDRERGRSYSRSPDMVRTWGRSRSSSRSRSRGRSRSWTRSRSRSRSRSWSRDRRRSYSRSRSWSRSPRRSRSWSRSPSHSHSHGDSRNRSCSRSRSRSPRRSYDKAHEPNFDQKDAVLPASAVLPESRTSLVLPGSHSNELREVAPLEILPVAAKSEIVSPGAGEDLHQAVGEL